jgi:hypothetical protein
MYIMTSESIKTTYYITRSHQSVCLFVNPLSVARQRIDKNVTTAMNTHATVE